MSGFRTRCMITLHDSGGTFFLAPFFWHLFFAPFFLGRLPFDRGDPAAEAALASSPYLTWLIGTIKRTRVTPTEGRPHVFLP